MAGWTIAAGQVKDRRQKTMRRFHAAVALLLFFGD
jgi:hypothetical protein